MTKTAAPQQEVPSKLKITTLSSPDALCHITTRISSRCLPLDHILGGGYPVRRIVEVFGDNSTGKTLLAVDAIIETQRMGAVAAYGDVEIALDEAWLTKLGVDPTKLLYFNPNTVEDAMTGLADFIEYKNKKFGIDTPLTFVWDSLAAIANKEEIEKSNKEGWETRQYPTTARLMSQAMHQLPAIIAENNVLYYVINQTREKIDVAYGDDIATYGGKAMSFYSTIRILLQTRGKIRTDAKEIIGSNVEATVIKNKLHPPFQSVLLPVYYSFGIDEAEASFNYLLTKGMIGHEAKSPWYSIPVGGEERKFQKKDWVDLFTENINAVQSLFTGGSNGSSK